MRIFPLLFMTALLTNGVVAAADRFTNVEIVVGQRMPDEGGTWDPADSPLKRPFGIAFNSDGIGFVVELEGGRVFELRNDNSLKQISGDGSKSYEGDGGPLKSATYNGMHNCAVLPNGDLLIGDTWNHCVRRIDVNSGTVGTWAGNGTPGFAGDGQSRTVAKFNFVMCITLNSDSSTLHIADLKNRRIRSINVKTGAVSTVAGNGKRGVPKDGSVAAKSSLVDPRAVAADSQGQIYILERGGHALRVVRRNGTIETVAGTGKKGFKDGTALQAEFASPKHICVDSADCVYIADDLNAAVRKYDPAAGTVTTVLGRGHGDKRLKLKNPHGVCIHGGALYVMDSSNNRIIRLNRSEPKEQQK